MNELLTCAIILELLIVAYVWFVMMLIGLKKVLSQELSVTKILLIQGVKLLNV
jgi:hypothetical protein